MTHRAVSLVFAKQPHPGQVKTRLAPVLGEAGAAELARAFLRDTWRRMRSLSHAPPILVFAGADSNTARKILEDPTAEVWQQGEGDLGARLERALAAGLERAPLALAVGTDSPGLPLAYLEQACASHADAVLGPSADGGYYLLGLRRCPSELLMGLPWSSPDTLSATRQRLESRGFSIARAPTWWDVDEPADLERLLRALAGGLEAPATLSCLRQLLPDRFRASPSPCA